MVGSEGDGTLWSAAGQRPSGLRRPNVSALNVNGLTPPHIRPDGETQDDF